MEKSVYELKKMGFRQKSKNRNEMEVHVEVQKSSYISISIFKNNNGWIFSGLEVEGKPADQLRKEFFTSYSMDEIFDFLDKY